MKYFIFVCCALFAITLVQAEDCKVGDHSIKVGEKFQPKGKCIIETCVAAGEVTALGCAEESVLNVEDYTLIPEDSDKKYPECCPRYVKKNP